MKTHYSKWLVLATMILFSSHSACHAAKSQTSSTSQDIIVHGETAKGVVTVGEPIEYKISVRHKQNIEILSSIGEPEMPGLELKGARDWQDREGQFAVVGKTFHLISYQLGNFLIAPSEISYRIKGDTPQTIKVNSTYISVKSVAEGEEKEDIRDV